MSKPKFQHWVPNFYLKKFASDKSRNTKSPKVFVLDKSGQMDSPRLMNTNKICGSNFLNTPLMESGERDFSLEDYFSKLESKAAGYWDTLAKGKFPFDDKHQRLQLSEFIAALHLRNKSTSDVISRIMNLRDSILGGPKFIDKEGNKSDILPFQKEADPTDVGRFFAASFGKWMPNIKNSFFRYQWVFAQFDDELVTSDRPVVFETPGERPSGPGNKNANSVFVISPNSAIMMFASKETDIKKTETRYVSGYSLQLNHLIYRKAERFIISKSNPEVLSLNRS